MRLSWICSTLTEFRQSCYATEGSICSLSGLTSVRKSARTQKTFSSLFNVDKKDEINPSFLSTLDAIRTHDLPLRRRLLYPAELPGRGSRGSRQTFGFLGYLYIPSASYRIIKISFCKVYYFYCC